MSVKKLTTLAVFTTVSLAIYAAESALPPLLPIPGAKLGLANIITLILLLRASAKDAFFVLLVRILLSALLFGQFLSLLYSLSGGMLSLLFMACTMKLLQKKLPFLTGAVGGLAHNLGQLLVAWAVTSVSGVFAYLPFLILSGILSGLFTGLCAGFTARHLLRRAFPSDIT